MGLHGETSCEVFLQFMLNLEEKKVAIATAQNIQLN